jgi:hypothetical protein
VYPSDRGVCGRDSGIARTYECCAVARAKVFLSLK